MGVSKYFVFLANYCQQLSITEKNTENDLCLYNSYKKNFCEPKFWKKFQKVSSVFL